PFASLGHKWGKVCHKEIRRLHVCGKDTVKLLFRHFMRRSERIDPGIVYENIHMAISEFDRFPCYFVCAVCASKFIGNKICFASCSANLVNRLLPALRISSHNQDMNSKFSEFPGCREADSTRPSCYKRCVRIVRLFSCFVYSWKPVVFLDPDS